MRAYLGELAEAVLQLRNEDDVHGRLRVDVLEGEGLLVLPDDVRGNLLLDDQVENGLLFRHCARDSESI